MIEHITIPHEAADREHAFVARENSRLKQRLVGFLEVIELLGCEWTDEQGYSNETAQFVDRVAPGTDVQRLRLGLREGGD